LVRHDADAEHFTIHCLFLSLDDNYRNNSYTNIRRINRQGRGKLEMIPENAGDDCPMPPAIAWSPEMRKASRKPFRMPFL